jgi:pyrimidine-nucleoside phosphorylase
MTDMDQPLGMAVGNALEVREAIETLRGQGPAELTELCLALGAKMLVMGGVAQSEAEGLTRCEVAISDGTALAVFRRWVAAQGGDARITDDFTLLPLSAHVHVVRAEISGYVAGFDAEAVGRAAMLLGAGRVEKDDLIDFGAGVQLAVRVGSQVEPGSLLCTMYTAEEWRLAGAEERFRAAVRFGDTPVTPPPLFHEL